MAGFSEPDFGDDQLGEIEFPEPISNGGPPLDFEGDTVNPDVMTSAAQGRMRTLIERIENVEVEITEAQDARKEIYAEAKGEGFDTKVLRKVIARRKVDKVKRDEEQALIDLYESALDMLR